MGFSCFCFVVCLPLFVQLYIFIAVHQINGSSIPFKKVLLFSWALTPLNSSGFKSCNLSSLGEWNLKLPDFLADLGRVPWSSAYTFDNMGSLVNTFQRCSRPARAPKEKVDSGRPMDITWFHTETNYSSVTSGILHLLLWMTISGNVTMLRRL